MDHNTNLNVKQEETSAPSNFNAYVNEGGKNYRVPYRMIKKAVFTGVSKAEMVDIPHAARLQYRLMLMDPVIKATVDFTKSKITILYNPREADNMREKIGIDELIEFLSKNGINPDRNKMSIEDYDYYKQLYTYAYNPDKIRERVPWGYTQEEWAKAKPEWEKKQVDESATKMAKYRKTQQAYLDANPEIAVKVDPNYKPTERKAGFFDKLLGKDKSKQAQKDKGFWFHGI